MAAQVPPAVVLPPVVAGVPNPPYYEMDQVLLLCGVIDPAARLRLINFEGLETIAEFGDANDAEITDMAKRNESRTPAAQRVHLGMTRIKKLKAVAFWARKQQREGVVIDINNLNAAVINDTIKEMTLAPASAKKDEKLFEPDKFEPKRYKQWSRSMANYLDSMMGQSGVPLSYVTRAADADPAEAESEYQRVIWSAPHVGLAYETDNRQVYRLYKHAMIGTEGWAWFNQTPDGDGRAAHIHLTDHYLGTAETSRRAAEAEAQLARLHYKNEASFPFEKYITRLYECFEALEDNQQGYLDAQKVKKMLENITSSSTEVVALKTIIRDRYPNDFAKASTHMAGQIALIFPAAQGEVRNKRRIASMDSRGRGDGRGRGRGRRTTMMNGVDVSDPTRSFTPDEWKKLQEGHHLAYIHEQRNQGSRGRGRGRGGRYGARDGGRGGRGGGRQGRNISSVSSVTDTNENNDDNTNASSGTGSGGRGSTRGGRGGVTFGGRRYAQQE
jgi:hypothetical protein